MGSFDRDLQVQSLRASIEVPCFTLEVLPEGGLHAKLDFVPCSVYGSDASVSTT